MTDDGIARLKITLDDVKPQVLRRIEVPLTIQFDRLHLALQAAMGWTNSHLYELRARHRLEHSGPGLLGRSARRAQSAPHRRA